MEIELEELGVERGRDGLVFGVVVGLEVRVCERVLDADPLLRIKRQRLRQEIDRHRGGVREERRKRSLLPERERADVVPASPGRDRVELVERGRAEDVEDERELMVVVPAGEKGFPREHLGQDAADAPDVDRFCVLLEGEHDLGRAVPPRRDVFGHEACLGPRRFRRLHRPGEAEVAHFEVAVGVEEEVGGLEVAVDDVGAVEGLEGAQGLVDEVLGVVVGEVLSADDAVHVGLHEFLDEVDFFEGLDGRRLDDV